MGGEEAKAAKERAVSQLLWDFPAWYAAFGGGVGYDTMKSMGQYGPAGIVFKGAEFRELNVHQKLLLAQSMDALLAATRELKLLGEEKVGEHSDETAPNPKTGKRERADTSISGFAAWSSLLEPYLGDPADPSVVDDRRQKALRFFSAKRFVEKHDAAVAWLAKRLKDTDLYPIFPKLMSQDEHKKMEQTNAKIYAAFCQLKRAGLSERAAVSQTAENFGNLVTVGAVERIVEFRSENKADTCLRGDCDRAPFRRNLCAKHYREQREAEKKGARCTMGLRRK